MEEEIGIEENNIEENLDSENKNIEEPENEEKKTKSNKKTRIERDIENLNYSAKQLMALPENAEFKHSILSSLEHIKKRKFLDEKEVYLELEKIAKKTMFQTDRNILDIKEYIYILDQIQAAKDRVSALYQQAVSDNNLVERVYNKLYKVWTGKFSKLSSDKRREGEAELILSWMWFTKIERKNILTYVKIFHENLNSKSEVVSRKITIHQESNRIVGGYYQQSPKEDFLNSEKSDV